ncbi:MAG: cysteine desulfurase [Alphaproteobacteria bacterium CG_4_9_14_3_um_filter_47_13]|nr:MAG: cysteine desulfurase [Alphaproteobacteria bacterium CG_4_9_14_3_um_filter_47_13]
MKDIIYLDYNATTPIKPDVIELVGTIMGVVGNASSVHGCGRKARSFLEIAREQISGLVGAHPNQIIFTCGATESNNAVLKQFQGQRILVSAIEHPAVRNALPDIEFIPVTCEGIVDLAAFEKMIGEGTPPALVSVMMVNNETGVIQPVEEIARLAKARHKNIFVHTDAVQAAGRIPIDFPALHVDYMSLSAHKMGGPQGVGALIAAPGAPVARFMHGGGQEKRQRAGTENVAGIAGFGLAAEKALSGMKDYKKLEEWRDRLEADILKIAPKMRVYGQKAPRVANTTALCLAGLPAQTQLMGLDLEGIAVSSGSACSSGTFKPSPILQAMGASDLEASSTLRISTGWNTKESDIDRFIEVWKKIYERVTEKTLQNA